MGQADRPHNRLTNGTILAMPVVMLKTRSRTINFNRNKYDGLSERGLVWELLNKVLHPNLLRSTDNINIFGQSVPCYPTTAITSSSRSLSLFSGCHQSASPQKLPVHHYIPGN